MDRIPPDLLRQFFDQAIPFNRVLGLTLSRIEEGLVEVSCPFRDELIGDPYRNALHGGVISALADTTGGAAVASLLGVRDRVSTVDIRVDYLRKGEPLDIVARGQVVRLGNRVGAARVEVFHPGAEAEPIAVAMAVYNVRRERKPNGDR